MMDKYNGIHAVNIAERFTNPIRGVYARMRNAMEILYPVKVDKEVFSECPDKFNLGFEIIGSEGTRLETSRERPSKCLYPKRIQP